MRTFLFKLHNNLLGLNTRVAKFVANHPRTCTFCDIRGEPGEYPETTLHLFYECTVIEENIQQFFHWIRADIIVGSRNYFTGFDNPNIHANKLLYIVTSILKKCIWDCKLRFTVPTIEILKQNFLVEINKLYSTSSFIRDLITKSALFANHNDIHF